MNRTEYFSLIPPPPWKKKKNIFLSVRCVYVHHHSECVRSLIITCRSLSRRIFPPPLLVRRPSSVHDDDSFLFFFSFVQSPGQHNMQTSFFSFLFHLYISALGPPRQIIIFMILGYRRETTHEQKDGSLSLKALVLALAFFLKIQITCRTCYNAHVPLDYGNCQD